MKRFYVLLFLTCSMQVFTQDKAREIKELTQTRIAPILISDGGIYSTRIYTFLPPDKLEKELNNLSADEVNTLYRLFKGKFERMFAWYGSQKKLCKVRPAYRNIPSTYR